MIKRETLKQAIDAIGRRDPEIGYALDEMLAVGKIDVPAPGQDPMLGDDYYFLFNDYKARVSRFLYINKGNIPIEERLLLKYGELKKKLELLEKDEPADTPEAAWIIRKAGLRFMVIHEINYAIERVRSQLEKIGADADTPAEGMDAACRSLEYVYSTAEPAERYRRIILFLDALKRELGDEPLAAPGRCCQMFYRGVVGEDTPADFTQFPYALSSLIQVADINIEFFHVRFFLNRLIQNQWQHLYACIAKNKIVGLLYLTFKGQLFHKNLEIKFIAAARSTPAEGTVQAAPPLRGVGTFLVAGAWLQWKTQLAEAKEILLDSEIGARRFYDSMGFVSRGLSEYILGTPRAYLLKMIVCLAESAPNMDPRVYLQIGKLLQKQVKSLRRRARSEKDKAERRAVIDAAAEFLKTQAETEPGGSLLRLFQKYHKKIPESADLLRICSGNSVIGRGENLERAAGSRN
ncbi:MAG: hypothetical protein AB1427_20555 [Thermodesulfobacteriota bacterium]